MLSLSDDPPDFVVRRAVTVLNEHPSRSVASVAAECDLSHKSLIARFRRSTGVTTNFYSMVVRFDRLIDELPLGDEVPWAGFTCDHLHFEIHPNGSSVDPFGHLRACPLREGC